MRMFKMIVLLAATMPVYAQASWPTFNVLTPTEVARQVMTDGCKKGEGRIPFGTKIKINATGIPADQTWYWEYAGTNQCQKMAPIEKPVKYLMFEQTGRTAGNTITTIYGDAINSEPLFSFTFTIPTEPEGWDCGPFVGSKPPETIGCARDM